MGSGRIVAMLGTGAMGAPMARRLLGAGFAVRAWNRTRERAEPLAADGAIVCDDPADAVAGADLTVTMLADGPAVESVVVGGGALAAMAAEAVWVQTSTVGVAASDRLAALAARRGWDSSTPRWSAPWLRRSGATSSCSRRARRSSARAPSPCWRRSAARSSGSARPAPAAG